MPHIDTVPQYSYWLLVVLAIALGIGTHKLSRWQDSSRATRKHALATVITGYALTLLVALYGIVVATSDNYFDVNSGTVVSSGYDPAHYTYSQSCSGSGLSRHCHQTSTYHDDDWTLKLHDDNSGHTGTVHFHDSDPRPAHPVGSTYVGS